MNANLSRVDGTLQLAGGEAIWINGETLVSDDVTAYVEMYLAHSWPVRITDKIALHSKTLLRSYRSMQHKVFNLGHMVKSYDRENISRDRIIGSIVGVQLVGPQDAPVYELAEEAEWPVTQTGGLRIRAVAAVHKQADGVDKLFGAHQSGRQKFHCSMEVAYVVTESGFIVERTAALPHTDPIKQFERTTPQGLRAQGAIYVPFAEAPPELKKCWSEKKNAVTKQYNGCETVLLAGGLDGVVQFVGIGVVTSPKEPTSRVERLLAGEGEVEMSAEQMESVKALVSGLAEAASVIQ